MPSGNHLSKHKVNHNQDRLYRRKYELCILRDILKKQNNVEVLNAQTGEVEVFADHYKIEQQSNNNGVVKNTVRKIPFSGIPDKNMSRESRINRRAARMKMQPKEIREMDE